MNRHEVAQHAVVAAALTLFALTVLVTGVAAAETEPEVSLRWALGALDSEADELSAVRRDARLESGTRLKFLVEPLSPGAVYLILVDSAEELHVLYREASLPVQQDGAQPAYIPPGKGWFELDGRSGQETFFLLASTEPLVELDALLDRIGSTSGAERGELDSKIVGEIRRLHKASRDFARPAEKPVMIGGHTRGTGDDESGIDQLAVEVTAERFYGKTITIDH